MSKPQIAERQPVQVPPLKLPIDDQKFDESTSLLGKDEQIRCIYSSMQPIEISTASSVLSMFTGQGSQFEHYVFYLGVKGRRSTFTMWACWFLGATIGLLAVEGVLPLKYVKASFMMLPLPIVTCLLLSRQLLARLLTSLDVFVINFLQLVCFLDALILMKGDKRCLFWWCYLPTMLVCPFIDAYPQRYRSVFGSTYFIASFIILVFWNVFVIRASASFKSSNSYAMLSFGLHHLCDMLTLSFFYGRYIWVSLFYPENFVLIKGDVCSKHEVVHLTKDTDTGREVMQLDVHHEIMLSSSRLAMDQSSFSGRPSV